MTEQLALQSTIGFGGMVPNGLHVHPAGKHVIFPLGATVVIRELGTTQHQEFLHGHSNKVSCIAVSKSGRLVASGQRTHMGFQAEIIVWDFATRKPLMKLALHKVKVQGLAFSPNEKTLASIGGEDDNSLVIWNLDTGKAVCGSPAHREQVFTVRFLNNSNVQLVTAGKYHVRLWDIDFQNCKVWPSEFQMGKNDRVFTSIAIDSKDSYLYCGTTTGDVLEMQLAGPKIFKRSGPIKQLFSKGIASVSLLSNDKMLAVGAGDGTVALLAVDTFKRLKEVSVLGAVSSIAVHPSQKSFFVGTDQSNWYTVNVTGTPAAPELKADLTATCHFERVNGIAFPNGYSDVFATCSVSDIRLWNAQTNRELLRISVPNLECNCVAFTANGKSVLSGWSDGKIRAFGPESGKLIFMINDAHPVGHEKKVTGNLLGVTAIASTSDSQRIVSGGSDGLVRIWKITPTHQSMVASMKEHKGTVNTIHIRSDDSECVSSSDDGSCIVWNLNKFVRNNIIYAQTYFKGACYLNDESQILTVGTDRKICYWDAFDCSEIRELECKQAGELHSVNISSDGNWFVLGGEEPTLRLFHYDEGVCARVGVGHSSTITKAIFAPNQKSIISVGEDGGIFIWRVPS